MPKTSVAITQSPPVEDDFDAAERELWRQIWEIIVDNSALERQRDALLDNVRRATLAGWIKDVSDVSAE